MAGAASVNADSVHCTRPRGAAVDDPVSAFAPCAGRGIGVSVIASSGRSSSSACGTRRAGPFAACAAMMRVPWRRSARARRRRRGRRGRAPDRQMKIFQCQACDQPVSFESTALRELRASPGLCLRGARDVGARALGTASGTPMPTRPAKYRFCANAQHAACNWLVPDDLARDRSAGLPAQPGGARPRGRLEPDPLAPDRGGQAPAVLLAPAARPAAPCRGPRARDGPRLRLPGRSGRELPDRTPVLTGHQHGLITLNIAEADDVERERRRMLFGEYYRTLLGHFRHEVGHYFWNVLVRDDPSLDDLPGPVRRRARRITARPCSGITRKAPAGLGGILRQRLCDEPPVGGFRRDLGPLPAHRRHARDREHLRAARAPAPAPRAGRAGGDRFRSPPDPPISTG